MTKEEISEKTRIPTGKSGGKVEPCLAYAEYMGVLTDSRPNGKHLIMRTELGSAIYRQDPGFQEDVTLSLSLPTDFRFRRRAVMVRNRLKDSAALSV